MRVASLPPSTPPKLAKLGGGRRERQSLNKGGQRKREMTSKHTSKSHTPVSAGLLPHTYGRVREGRIGSSDQYSIFEISPPHPPSLPRAFKLVPATLPSPRRSPQLEPAPRLWLRPASSTISLSIDRSWRFSFGLFLLLTFASRQSVPGLFSSSLLLTLYRGPSRHTVTPPRRPVPLLHPRHPSPPRRHPP